MSSKNFNDISYLDNNATTCVAPEVVEAMMPFLRESYGNPSSMYRFGGMVKRHVEHAREQVAALIGAKSSEIIFTSCGTESDNMAIKGFCADHNIKDNNSNTNNGAKKIITSNVEHPAVRNTVRFLEKSQGVKITELPVDENGMIADNAFDNLDIDNNTLVTIMWANNETGVIFPIEKIAQVVKSRGGFFHTDAVQATGKVAINVNEIPIDMLAISGHKLHAPKGVGAAYFRSGTKIHSFMHGGHQEHGLRGGTENVPYIIGLGRACELAMKKIDEENTRVRAMRDRLERELLARCTGAKVNGANSPRLPNTLNISFENIEGEAILLHLDEYGIAASSGSACTTGSLEPSHVMMAMGLPYKFAHSSIRFSLSTFNTDADIDKVIDVMPAIVDKLRNLSPFV